jgi:iron complex outermembrane recepter protein
VEGEYFNIDKVSYLGIPASGTVIPNPLGKIPRSQFLDDPSVKLDREFYGFGYRFQHKFSDTWSIRNGFSAQLDKVDESYTYSLGLRPDNRTLNRGGSFLELDAKAYFLQTDVIGSLQTGNVKQDLLFGLEFGWIDEGLKSFRPTSPVAAIDIFNPNYNTPPLQFTFTYKDKRSQDSVGVYAQDLISIGDQFKILLGGRFDFVTTAYERKDRGIDTEREDTAFSPRVGIVYQPVKPVSLYASWSRSLIGIIAN